MSAIVYIHFGAVNSKLAFLQGHVHISEIVLYIILLESQSISTLSLWSYTFADGLDRMWHRVVAPICAPALSSFTESMLASNWPLYALHCLHKIELSEF